MKRILNIIVVGLVVALISSCSSMGSVNRSAEGYGYYDNMYYSRYPSYYPSYRYYQRPIIRNEVIIVPEKRKVVRNNGEVKRRQVVSPDTRRTESQSHREAVRSTAPQRRSLKVSSSNSSRRSGSASPSSRSSVGSNSRRGSN